MAVDPWAPPVDALLDPQVDALLELEELPDYVSDSDPGESEVGGFFQWFAPDEEEEDEGEDDGEADDQCVPPEELWYSWGEVDPDHVSLFEEEEREEEEDEAEEDDQCVPSVELWDGWHPLPAQDLLPEGLVLQLRAESPSPASRALQRMLEDLFPREDRDQLCPSSPAPALDFIPLGGSKRSRDEDEDEEDSTSKRLRLSSSEDPSTSAGTSGGFTRYFHYPHLLQDPDSDED